MSEQATVAEPTPRLADFLVRYEVNDNVWWTLSGGDHMNLFDEALEEMDKARRAVGWVVEAAGGRLIVPRTVMQRDWLLTAEDTIDGGRRFITAPSASGSREFNDG